ncbi:cytochrome-c oxidase, cbb3-type subunit II [Psychrobacter okhotskensis]|uniref:cytochrome-c oxidase, cbb3-type subunit II n=1 Tax=Psychrobacter okhotskensis TaxID=212403 RepID=UPI00156620A8|nr:cytochrome-c oxidase, cbb3-type subunit II [Psychrobacter okhotskensis]NRD70854.1 cytochrome-c oxidase, cbb3-type subunit II [Psychrobacter okhotskensis]
MAGTPHEIIEKNTGLLVIGIVIAISFATLVEIVPLIYDNKSSEDGGVNAPLPAMEPWTALEFEGRDIYIREGCHVCHTQMVRPLRAEVERYGPYSRAAESTWDHPFLWGSKRTGPDLARVGGRYSEDWQKQHLIDPRSLVPESVMPGFPWLATNEVNGTNVQTKMRLFRDRFGVPYTEEDIEGAPDAVLGATELDALVAYLQQLGTAMEGQR